MDSASYVSLLQSLFKRSPPECLTNRWYSSDIASWFYLLMWRFSILEHALPIDSHLAWWPGMKQEDVDGDLVPNEVIAKKKSVKTREFARSYDLIRNTAVCCISSIPRWIYARALESKSSDPARKYCVVQAKSAIFESTKSIILGNDPLVEVLIRDEDQPDLLRSLCVKSLLASLLYIIYSERKYSSTAWKIARGEAEFSEAANLDAGRRFCCEETGFSRKASIFAKRAEAEDSLLLRESLIKAFECGRAIVRRPGGFTTVDLEGLFSQCRNIGLRCPFRSMMFSTVLRELILRWADRTHRNHFVCEIKKIFGGIEELEALNIDRASSMNSYTSFLARIER